MIKKYLIILVIAAGIILPSVSVAQPGNFQFEQIESLQSQEKRIVVVFIHTDWCKYCDAMDNTTFANNDITEKINKQFYFINFNAEEKRNIKFNGFEFRYKPTGNSTGINELATELGTVNGKLSYPSLCFLNAENEIIFQYPGYLNSKELLNILTWISASQSAHDPLLVERK